MIGRLLCLSITHGVLTLVTSACFSVGETLEGGGIHPAPFEDTEWSDKKKLKKNIFCISNSEQICIKAYPLKNFFNYPKVPLVD